MRKKTTKQQVRQHVPAKTKTAAAQGSSWLVRPPVHTELDPFYKKIFLGWLAAVLVLTVVLALGSGINGDDEYQHDYSAKLVGYYTSMGADTAALNIPKGNMHYYGGLFDIVTGMVNNALGYEWTDAGYHHVRHIFNALFGVLAMLFTALLAKEIAGWRAGILTLLLLFLSPRFLGHSLMNPKDIPFAAGYMMALYYMALFFKNMPKPQWKLALGIAGGIALAIATRAGGMLLIAYLGMFAGIDFLMKNGVKGVVSDYKKTVQYAVWALGIALSGYLLALLFWPWALQAPFSRPFEALGEFSKLGVKIRVLFKGENVMSDRTSWDYALQWIWRTVPLFALLGFAGSLVFLGKILKRYQVLPVLLVLFAGVFPVFYIIYKDSILHDGWRHLLFVYPPLLLMAAMFYVTLEDTLRENKTGKYALWAAIGLMALEPAVFIARNAKYPYVYFNPAAGGMSGAFGKYETDYWGLSMKQAVDWLEATGKISPDMKDTVTIATSFSYVTHAFIDKKYGGKVPIKYVRFNARYETDWDYGIFPSRYIKGPHLRSLNWPNKRSIHTITANGIPLTSIEQGGGAVFEGEKAFKIQDWVAAAEAFRREVQQYGDNELAWMKLAITYANQNNFPESKNAADRLLQIAPDNTSGLLYRGLASLNTGDVNAAERDFRRAIEVEDDFSTAFYYLALIEHQRSNNQAALEHLQKAIEQAPRFKAAYELAAQIYEQMGDTQRAAQLRSASAQL